MDSSPALDLSSRYPIGKFTRPSSPGESQRLVSIAVLAALPENLLAAVAGLDDLQLDTPYREGGWTVRQVVHHIADSHMNAYIRFKLALTEDWPTIKPYREDLWAQLADARTMPVDVSLDLLKALHRRWVTLLESLSTADWRRGYVHPEMGRQTLDEALTLYNWHSRHHTAHITELRKRMGW